MLWNIFLFFFHLTKRTDDLDFPYFSVIVIKYFKKKVNILSVYVLCIIHLSSKTLLNLDPIVNSYKVHFLQEDTTMSVIRNKIGKYFQILWPSQNLGFFYPNSSAFRNLCSLIDIISLYNLASTASTALFPQFFPSSWWLDHPWHQIDQYTLLVLIDFCPV